MEVSDTCQTVLFQLPNKSAVYQVFIEIQMFYKPVHAYVSIALCILGAICNFCNIVVLTRKQMRTPVNMILTAMACCDTVVLFSNLVYTTHYTFVAFENCVPQNWSYGWAIFLVSHAHLSLVGHSSSIWLSVMLALIRYITLRQRGKSNGPVVVLKHSYIAIASVLIFVSITNTPNFLTYKIKSQTLVETCSREQIQNSSLYLAPAFVPGISDFALLADCLVFRLAFWISGTVFKMLPCILLTVLVSLLTRILKEVRENRHRLLLGNKTFTSGTYVSADHSSGVPVMSEFTTLSIGVGSGGGLLSPAAHRSDLRRPTIPADQFCEPQMASTMPTHKIIITAPSLPVAYRSNGVTPVGTQEHSPSPSYSHTPQGPNSGGCRKSLAKTLSRRRKSEGAIAAIGRTDRTTRMLLAIVCVFLVTELPQGIMAVLSGMFSEEFRYYIYNSVGDILDLLSLCNACTSFIIYCSMSAQFRNEFRRVFFPTQMKCWLRIISASERRRCRKCKKFFPRPPKRHSLRNSKVCKRCSSSSLNAAGMTTVPNESLATRLLKPLSVNLCDSEGSGESSSRNECNGFCIRQPQNLNMSDAESYVSVNEASNVVKLREMDDQQSTSSGPSSSQSQSSGCSRVELPIKLRPLTIDVSTVPREGEEGGGGGVHLSHTTMKQNGSISLGHHHHSSTNGGSKMMSDGHETPQSEACCFLNEASAEAKLLKKRISLPGSHPKTAVPTENPSSLVAKQQQQQLNGPGSEPPSMVLQQKKNGLSAVIKAQRYHI